MPCHADLCKLDAKMHCTHAKRHTLQRLPHSLRGAGRQLGERSRQRAQRARSAADQPKVAHEGQGHAAGRRCGVGRCSCDAFTSDRVCTDFVQETCRRRAT